MTSGMEVMLPAVASVFVDGVHCEIRKLSIRQTTRAIRCVMSLRQDVLTRVMQAAEAGKEMDVATIVGILADEPGKVGEFLAILANKQDDPVVVGAFDDMSMEGLGTLVTAFMKMNDLEKLYKDFSQAVEMITALVKKATPHSPPPSVK